MTPVREALELVLARPRAYPALVVDRGWEHASPRTAASPC